MGWQEDFEKLVSAKYLARTGYQTPEEKDQARREALHDARMKREGRYLEFLKGTLWKVLRLKVNETNLQSWRFGNDYAYKVEGMTFIVIGHHSLLDGDYSDPRFHDMSHPAKVFFAIPCVCGGFGFQRIEVDGRESFASKFAPGVNITSIRSSPCQCNG